MEAHQYRRVKHIFLAVCNLPPHEQDDVLDDLCAGDLSVRTEVRRLLRHHSQYGEPGEATVIPPTRPQITGDDSPPVSLSASLKPGTVVANRYRILAEIGSGGMGRVYSAEDDVLRQTVAIKLLDTLGLDESWRLERLKDEVRLARAVTHSSVCRVFDFEEDGSDRLISMELVDGEDLNAIIRRIGRLPIEKAQEVIYQIAIGVAAIHARGILHRDLKPANVMLDRDGRAKVMDFGLAALAGRLTRKELAVGTPLYMAPEQFASIEVTERSDIFALGLLSYELLTGRHAYLAGGPKAQTHPPPPSDLAPGIPPEVDRMVLRCLESNPAARPESAIEVAASLPGRDILTAAEAIGVTPTPDMVAASASASDSRRRVDAYVAAAMLVMICAYAWFAGPLHWLAQATSRDPALLLDTSRRLVGYGGADSDWDEAYGFADGLSLRTEAPLDSFSDRLSPAWSARGVVFWYRTAASPLVPTRAGSLLLHYGQTRPFDPPPSIDRAMTVFLDPSGRLLMLTSTGGGVRAVDASGVPWHGLFEAAELDPSNYRAASPVLIPPTYATVRYAWTGRGEDSTAVRIEAADRNGAPVWFSVFDRLSAVDMLAQEDLARRGVLTLDARLVFMLPVLVCSAALAFVNWRRRRVDLRGGRRLAMLVMGVRLAAWYLRAHHSAEPLLEIELFLYALFAAGGEGLLVWVGYTAVEPYVRLRFPTALIAWTRLTAGRVADPLVGRALLIGTTLGVWLALVFLVDQILPSMLGWTPRDIVRRSVQFEALMQGRYAAATFLDTLRFAVYEAMLVLVTVVVTRRLIPTAWLAYAAVVMIVTLPLVPGGAHVVSSTLLFGLGVAGVLVVAMVRQGLLCGIVAVFVGALLARFPVAHGQHAWYADLGYVGIACALAIAACGFALSFRRPLGIRT